MPEVSPVHTVHTVCTARGEQRDADLRHKRMNAQRTYVNTNAGTRQNVIPRCWNRFEQVFHAREWGNNLKIASRSVQRALLKYGRSQPSHAIITTVRVRKSSQTITTPCQGTIGALRPDKDIATPCQETIDARSRDVHERTHLHKVRAPRAPAQRVRGRMASNTRHQSDDGNKDAAAHHRARFCPPKVRQRE